MTVEEYMAKRGIKLGQTRLSQLMPSRLIEEEPDAPENIPEDETHLPDCEIYITGECSCKT